MSFLTPLVLFIAGTLGHALFYPSEDAQLVKSVVRLPQGLKLPVVSASLSAVRPRLTHSLDPLVCLATRCHQETAVVTFSVLCGQNVRQEIGKYNRGVAHA